MKSSATKSSVLLLGCALMAAGVYAADTAAPAPNLHELMKNVVAIQTQVIWDVGNTAQDDAGNPDAPEMKPADWSKVGTAAGKVKDGGCRAREGAARHGGRARPEDRRRRRQRRARSVPKRCRRRSMPTPRCFRPSRYS